MFVTEGMVLRQRLFRFSRSVSLALLLSLINTLIILLYLGPSTFNNPDTGGLPKAVRPVMNDKTVRDAQPSSKTDSAASKFSLTGTMQDLNPVQSQPNYNKNVVSVVKQPASNPGIQQPVATTVDSGRNNVEVITDWMLKHPAYEDENIDHAYKQLKFNHNAMSLVGKPPKNPVDIVIGIPTVLRTSSDYLSSTLRHLVDYLSVNETRECHIVVFSADFDAQANKKTADFVMEKFKKEVNSGLIEVIKPDKAFYPKLASLPLLWKDKPDRVKWRSKQCVDYALLFAYCHNLGNYYLQLEDDISVAPNYFNQIKLFIQARSSSKWSNLQFGSRGFIGMLFRRSDLARMALFVKMYYWIFPVDILFRHFNDIHLYGNSARDIYSPPLFRHVGVESSLKGQTRKLENNPKENKPYINVRQYKDATNPQSLVSTNIEVFGGNTVDGPYRTTNLRCFWGKSVKVSDFVLIEFLKELTLLRVVVDSGSKFAPEDVIGEGKLETAGVTKDGQCDVKNFSQLKSTKTGWKIEASSDKFGGIPGVKCVRLTITKLTMNKGKPRWLVIREIAVWSQ